MKNLIFILLVVGRITIASDQADQGCFSRIGSWFDKTFGTKKIELANASNTAERFMFDSQKNHAVSFEIFRLHNDMIGVTDIETKDGKRHIQVKRSMSISIDDQIKAFVDFRENIRAKQKSSDSKNISVAEELLSDNVIKCFVTLFYSRETCSGSYIVDAPSRGYQEKFSEQSDKVIPVVCSYVPVGGSEHHKKNHFKYIIHKNKAECELVTSTSNGEVMDVFAEYSRKDGKITSPIQGVSATSSVLTTLSDGSL